MKPKLDDPLDDPHRALMARKWFAKHAPPDAPPLPLSYCERERLKVGGLPHVVAWFGSSLECRHFAFVGHPYFEDYARGVLASPYAPAFITRNPVLTQRFPPRALRGLGPGLVWRLDCTPATIRRSNRSQQRFFLKGAPPVQPEAAEDLIVREAANVFDEYAPWARHFLCVSDRFIAHATTFASSRCLSGGWSMNCSGGSFSRRFGGHELTVRAADHGWLIQRNPGPDPDEAQVLAHLLFGAPVLCPTAATAARLAEACSPVPHPNYYLNWYNAFAETPV